MNDAERVGDVEQPEREAVAGLLVATEGGVERDAPVAGRDDGAGEQLGVAQRVGEAVRADRVLPVARIADERPPRSPRPSHDARAAHERAHTERRGGRGDASGERRRRVAQHLLHDTLTAGSHSAGRAADEHARLAVVRRDDACAGARAEVPLVAGFVALGFEVAPVAVDDRGRARAEAHDRRADALRDRRAGAVRADHESGVERDALTLLVATDDAGDATLVVPLHAGDGDAEAHVGAGALGRVDQDRVEHGAARRVQRVDAVCGLDLHDEIVVGVVERHPAHRGRVLVDHVVEQPPTVELHDAAAHQRMRREGVGAVAAAVDDEHAHARIGEQHGRGGTRSAGADHDDVVSVFSGGGPERAHDSAGVDVDADRHAVGEDVVDGRALAGLLDDLAQLLGVVARELEADLDLLVAVADARRRQPEDAEQVDVALDGRLDLGRGSRRGRRRCWRCRR